MKCPECHSRRTDWKVVMSFWRRCRDCGRIWIDQEATRRLGSGYRRELINPDYRRAEAARALASAIGWTAAGADA